MRDASALSFLAEMTALLPTDGKMKDKKSSINEHRDDNKVYCNEALVASGFRTKLFWVQTCVVVTKLSLDH